MRCRHLGFSRFEFFLDDLHDGDDVPARNDAAAAVLAELALELEIGLDIDGEHMVSTTLKWPYILSLVTSAFSATLLPELSAVLWIKYFRQITLRRKSDNACVVVVVKSCNERRPTVAVRKHLLVLSKHQ